ncbi:MAG: glycosyl hydrolase family 28 protein [Nostocaceae cyanobacterium]|nr:glycosyl hydrolase family 28 protein [Nostocaceae cyanobacterium]
MNKKFFRRTGFVGLAFIAALCSQLYPLAMSFINSEISLLSVARAYSSEKSVTNDLNTKSNLELPLVTKTSQVLASTASVSNPTRTIVTYPPTSTQRSSTYSVTINGQPVVVEKYNSISYAHFAFAGKVDIEVTVKENVNNYTLSPKRYNIPSTKNGNKISLSLTEPRKMILHKVNNLDEKLFILADPLDKKLLPGKNPNIVNILNYGVDNTGSQDITDKIQQAIDDTAARQGILYFPPGLYKTRQLNLKSNLTLHLEGGSVLKGTDEINPSFGHGLLNLENVTNVKIQGRGVLDGNGSYWRNNGGWYSLINISKVRDVSLQDIIIRDPAVANVWIEYSENVNIYNTKILADPQPKFVNTDGFDFWSSRNITVDNVLYKGTDDATSHGGDKNQPIQNNENINVRNSVFYSGAAFKMGTTATQDFIKNITYENIDVVYADAVSGLWPVTGANFENIFFKNIRVEDILSARNEWGSASMFEFRILVASWEPNSSPNNLGYIRNVFFQNLNVDTPGGEHSIFEGYDAQSNISKVIFDNFYLQNNLVTKPEDAYFNILPSEQDGNNYVRLRFTQSNPTIVNITANQMYASESGTVGEFIVTRTGDNSQPLTVRYTIRGTASNGKDYQTLARYVTIPAGADSIPIRVQAIRDNAQEGLETVFISLNNLPNSRKYMLGPNFHAVVNISD